MLINRPELDQETLLLHVSEGFCSGKGKLGSGAGFCLLAGEDQALRRGQGRKSRVTAVGDPCLGTELLGLRSGLLLILLPVSWLT